MTGAGERLSFRRRTVLALVGLIALTGLASVSVAFARTTLHIQQPRPALPIATTPATDAVPLAVDPVPAQSQAAPGQAVPSMVEAAVAPVLTAVPQVGASVETVAVDLISTVQTSALGPVLRVLGPLTGPGPFEMLGATWEGAAESIRARVRTAEGWSDWFVLERGEEQPDVGEAGNGAVVARTSSEPVWVGLADAYELEVPAGTSGVLAHLVRPGTGPDVAQAAAVQAPGAPPVILRSGWGARPAKKAASYAPSVKVAFIHHTVNSNGYQPGDVPRLLRGIQAYHQDANGWSDIGYNFLVDRFGTVWEGREGDIHRPVIGAHTGGFNRGSVGIAVIGNFSSIEAPPAAIDSVVGLVAWKLGTAGVDPFGTTTLTSAGNEAHPAGAQVTFNNVSGHSDAKPTACPGSLYGRLDEIRWRAAALMAPAAPAPRPPGLLDPVLDPVIELLRTRVLPPLLGP